MVLKKKKRLLFLMKIYKRNGRVKEWNSDGNKFSLNAYPAIILMAKPQHKLHLFVNYF